ncbi:putative translation factor Sua5p homolog [Thermococcus kodakarensis KOD1]|uniref:Threonylcarbamoyl-AMP synthase n=1 Tax=Thermococcus kodakarensis (strain ATCC BAA-918 / JCM 12380 / KOD1) TaxID=69014 RepID=Q5JIA4_THEKO|nr:L-threonylcarbamoyladenylate synthase [Thermococcus kodakarensis]WCN28931.1 L-threonylcarbamoyladenylate synthase [Thermococcus kodakarensis]WCN31233.1 L-threonylcarbamoyladenylate synthase [Thermococcus kodakarensis]BAD85137.1 putative translation factor Sua5p homolog [Thermococcus kodakarensis KOD1]
MTIVINMRDGLDEKKIKVAARLILEGKLVAFPTETVYGLGADALNEGAVRRIFEAKGRPADNPLIIHIASIDDLEKVAREVPEKAKLLAERFWPGPLTLVLPKREEVPLVTTGGLDTVAVRMPAHPIALALIRASTPLAAPSANISGKPSPTSAEHVIDDFYGKIEGIIDGGETWVGVESTVVDLTEEPPVLLRPGGIPLEELEKVIGPIRIHPAVKGKKIDLAKAPGMKYKHYAPNAMVIVVEGTPENRRRKIQELVDEYRKKGHRVGVMATFEVEADEFYFLGKTLEEVARNLFKALRELDKRGVDVIIAEGVEEVGVGLAVMNRLRKAAGYNIVKA